MKCQKQSGLNVEHKETFIVQGVDQRTLVHWSRPINPHAISFSAAVDSSMWDQTYLVPTALHIKSASFCILPQNLLQHCKKWEELTEQVAVVRGNLMHLERNNQ